MNVALLALIFVLMACLAAIAARAMKWPYAIALVAAGLLAAATGLLPQLSLSREAAFGIILPPILFLGGMRLDVQHLKRDWSLTAFLAVFGVILSALLVGGILSALWRVPLNYALLFGAMLSATDPVSVLAILKKMEVPGRLRTLLEAESLFNDGTGIVLFVVFLQAIQNHQPIHLVGAFGEFLLVAAGGSLVGVLCGGAAGKAMAYTGSITAHTAITALTVFGTPFVAQALHGSGIMAVVAAGLTLAQAPVLKPDTASYKSLDRFWGAMDFAMNAIVFLMIGIRLEGMIQHDLWTLKAMLFYAVAAVLVSRALIVYPSVWIYNKAVTPRVPQGWDHVLFWGGLRGTIPILLALQLPSFAWRELFVAATCAIVLFSLVVQGLTMEPLVRRVGEE